MREKRLVNPEDLDDEIKAIEILGFDEECGWNPTISLHNDGLVSVDFPEFPPPNLEQYEFFDEELKRRLGNCEVCQEDREYFEITSNADEDADVLWERVAEMFFEWENDHG